MGRSRFRRCCFYYFNRRPTLLAQSANQLLDAFGSGRASPGSGSAAAMMGLLAVKLICTVCLKSLEKESCRSAEATLRHIRDRMVEIDPLLRVLFEKDAREFEEVIRLIGERESATTPEAKGALSRQINAMLEGATDNVFAIIDLCLPLIDHGVTVFKNGWGTVRGDSGAAISSAIAAVTSGLFIANLNIKWLKGRRYARDNIGRGTALLTTLQQKQLAANACITSLNSEALASIEVEATDDRQLPLELDDNVSAAPASGESP
ncbi:cyclodeaminase/cyclohydrolase family protein [Paraburkholderia sp. BL18I3N2]|uniref:cyclodeaminase/cyclohydrolase family protein n=1 Tax=Paraburkholderia sp. BL18I3N2 TaxID=1938799 RepID=UPI000D05D505|nr:cyclodeaminase/cyclohydrolase family protein [Paraburkholderia sp. BL18I3N2]